MTTATVNRLRIEAGRKAPPAPVAKMKEEPLTLSGELVAAIEARDTARAQLRHLLQVETIENLRNAIGTRAADLAKADPETAAAIGAELATLHRSLTEAEGARPPEAVVNAARAELRKLTSTCVRLATAQHEATVAPLYAVLRVAVDGLYDTLDAIDDARCALQEKAGFAIDAGAAGHAREGTSRLATVLGQPVRTMSPTEARQLTADRDELARSRATVTRVTSVTEKVVTRD